MYRPSNPLGVLLFDTTDIFGKRVVLEKDRFDEHIAEHVEMVGNEVAIQESIENPYLVYKDSEYSHKLLYIGKSKSSSYPWLSVKTVVDHSLSDFGFVSTSFFVKDNKLGKVGELIYDKKNTGKAR